MNAIRLFAASDFGLIVQSTILIESCFSKLPIDSDIETPIIFLVSRLHFELTEFPMLVFMYVVSIRSSLVHDPREIRVS